MKFDNKFKGNVTQTIIQTLLEHSDYCVVPLGIEELIREIKMADGKQYNQLLFPNTLRTLPDFLILEKNFSKKWLIEVKYRKEWNKDVVKKLLSDIEKQVLLWDEIYLAIFTGTSSGEKDDYPSSWLRFMRLVPAEGKIMHKTEDTNYVCPYSLSWKDLMRIQDIFPNISNNWNEQTLRKVTKLIRPLGSF